MNDISSERLSRFLQFGLICLSIMVALNIKRWGLDGVSRSEIPKSMLGHPVEFSENLISPEVGRDLLQLVLKEARYPSNIAADLKTGGFKILHKHKIPNFNHARIVLVHKMRRVAMVHW